jgi:hypothetical protein
MFKIIIKKKLRRAFAALLAISFIITGGTLSVLANTNGGGDGTPGSGATASTWGPRGMDEGIAIFLTDLHPYLLDNNLLQGNDIMRHGAAYDAGWRTMREREYSLNKVFAQVFRRTYISWLEPSAQASLLLVGWNQHWQPSNLGIGYNHTNRSTNEVYRRHRVSFSGTCTHGHWGGSNKDESHFWQGMARTGSYQCGTWSKSSHTDGSGMFKQQIVDYMQGWFATPRTETETPHQFLDRLYTNAVNNPSQMNQASYLWSYIAAGSGNMSETQMAGGNINLSAAQRWEQVFAPAVQGEMTWANTFITKDGLVTTAGGPAEPIPSWNSSDVGAKQVASYIDSLLTLALVARHSGSSDIAMEYRRAARNVFAPGGAWATEPSQMVQTHAIVIELTRAQNWNMGSASTITGSTDWWVLWQRNQRGGTWGDFRNDARYLSDIKVNPLLENSTTFNAWAGPVRSGSVGNGTVIYTNESVCRLALRLHAMQPANASPRLTTSSNNVEVTAGGVVYGGMVNFAPTASLLGINRGGDVENISHGINAQGIWQTAANINMVGPQFLIGMYGHNDNPPPPLARLRIPITHSIETRPKAEHLDPRHHNQIQENPIIEYWVSTGFGEGENRRRASPDLQLETRIMNEYDTFIRENSGAQVQIRTSFARRTQVYMVYWRDVAGGPNAPRNVPPNINPQPIDNRGQPVLLDSTDWIAIPNRRTASGNLTISTLEFQNNVGWSPLSKSQLQELVTRRDPFLQFEDTSYRTWSWPQLPPNTVEMNNGMRYDYKTGALYFIIIDYRADTQIRVLDPARVPLTYDYGSFPPTNSINTSVTRATGITGSPANALPMSLARVFHSVAEGTGHDFAMDSASWHYMKIPDVEISGGNTIIKPHIPFAVYSSSPEAFAELKNWGIASRNEPGDLTGNTGIAGNGLNLGDGRSPVDTQAGVQHRSNGSNFIAEDYEVMAGVPTTEKLYLAVGGSEFIIDLAVQYVPNETAVRAYHSVFSGVSCRFYWNQETGSASGGGSDVPNAAHWRPGQIPQVQANGYNANVSGVPTHKLLLIFICLYAYYNI